MVLLLASSFVLSNSSDELMRGLKGRKVPRLVTITSEETEQMKNFNENLSAIEATSDKNERHVTQNQR